jgi:hypothetical protein
MKISGLRELGFSDPLKMITSLPTIRDAPAGLLYMSVMSDNSFES